MDATEALRKVLYDTDGDFWTTKALEFLIMRLWVEGYKIVPVEEKDLDPGDPGSERASYNA